MLRPWSHNAVIYDRGIPWACAWRVALAHCLSARQSGNVGRRVHTDTLLPAHLDVRRRVVGVGVATGDGRVCEPGLEKP